MKFPVLSWILGHTGTAYPWVAVFEYEGGIQDRVNFWADDIDEAMKLCKTWMPRRTSTMDGPEGKVIKPVRIIIERVPIPPLR